MKPSERVINKNNFVIDINKVVCSTHFHPSCIEIDKQAQLLDYTPHRRRATHYFLIQRIGRNEMS